jgi:hypothetical protein
MESAEFAAVRQGRAVKPLWWLTYRRDGELSGVVIVEGKRSEASCSIEQAHPIANVKIYARGSGNHQ